MPMRALPECFTLIPDPRRRSGRRHRLPVVPGIAAGAVLCGMRGYQAITNRAGGLGQKARERFGCRRETGHYPVPGELVIRDGLIRIEPDTLIGRWMPGIKLEVGITMRWPWMARP